MNKIYILEVVGYRDYESYDEHVVVASSENHARNMANENVGDEGEIWNNPLKVTCKEVDTSTAAIICSSFMGG